MTWTAPKLQGVLFSKKQLIFYNDMKKDEDRCLQDNIMLRGAKRLFVAFCCF